MTTFRYTPSVFELRQILLDGLRGNPEQLSLTIAELLTRRDEGLESYLAFPFTSYTPASTNITVGNGTQVAEYCRIGGSVVIVRWTLTWGTTTGWGGGDPRVGLPVAAYGTGWHIGVAHFQQTGIQAVPGTANVGVVDYTSALLMHDGRVAGTNGNVAALRPFAWAATDVASMTLVYHAVP